MIINNDTDMKAFGERIGAQLQGGECIELVGDVGAGKTTFVKGLAQGLEIDEDIQSPSFTISRVYAARDGLSLQHYDFYRLSEPGVMSYELAESLADPKAITVIEWAETLEAVLPENHTTITISYLPDSESREVEIISSDDFDLKEEE